MTKQTQRTRVLTSIAKGCDTIETIEADVQDMTRLQVRAIVRLLVARGVVERIPGLEWHYRLRQR